MKKFLFAFLALIVAVSCYDDTGMQNKLKEQNQTIYALQTLCDQMKGDIASIKTLMDEMSSGGVVTSVEPIMNGEEVVGYTLTFKSGASIDIYSRNDGESDNQDQPVAESIFKEVTVREGYVTMVLTDDTVIELPLRLEDTTAVKSYYLDEIAKTKASLLSLLTEPCLVFPMITDIHYLAESSDSPSLIDDSVNNILELSKDIRFDFLACLGDLTQGNKAMSETEAEVRHVYEQFRKLGIPFYLSIGNHDTNIYYKKDGKYMKDHVFSLSQLYGLYVRDISDVTFDMSSMCGTNYYKDFSQFNIRCIFLNSNEGDDYGFSDATLEWFTSAMNTDRDVYVFSHRKPGTTYHNDTQMTAVMTGAENFKMFFFGHVHYDCEFTAPFDDDNPVLAFAQRCNKCYQQNYSDTWPEQAVLAERKVGTYTEDCFDIVVIRPNARKVNLVRFGAGVDREFDLQTGESVGESSAELGEQYDLKIELDFSKEWPFDEPCVAAESQTETGEVYTHTYSYREDGTTLNKQVKFVISKGKSADCGYKYVEPEGASAGNLFYDIVDGEGSGNSFGLLSVPYVEGMYIQSVSVVHSSSDTRRFNLRKGWTTASASTDASGWLKKNVICRWDFPLSSSIAPGIGTATSGLRDYAVSMRTADTNLKKATFYYSKTKPE